MRQQDAQKADALVDGKPHTAQSEPSRHYGVIELPLGSDPAVAHTAHSAHVYWRASSRFLTGIRVPPGRFEGPTRAPLYVQCKMPAQLSKRIRLVGLFFHSQGYSIVTPDEQPAARR